MTRRTNTLVCSGPSLIAAAHAVSSIRWALGCGALLGAFACQNASEPKLQSEPARASSAAESPAAAPKPSAAAPSTPSAQVGLAKYEESSAAAPSSSAQSNAASSGAAPAPSADAPKAAGGQTVQGTIVQDESFSTWLQAASPVTAGSPATVEAVLVAKAPYHCNADYPHKFKLGAAPAGLSYPEATVKGMQVTAERSVLRIPVVAQGPGKATVSGMLHFSVCNEERCLVEKRELSLDLEVK